MWRRQGIIIWQLYPTCVFFYGYSNLKKYIKKDKYVKGECSASVCLVQEKPHEELLQDVITARIIDEEKNELQVTQRRTLH